MAAQHAGLGPDFTLIIGERRLRACRDILGLAQIEADIQDIDCPVRAEHDENIQRKPFTKSELAQVAQAYQESLGERRGRGGEENLERVPGLKKGRMSRDLAAQHAGLGSGWTFEHIKKVLRDGVPALVDAMDAEKISVGEIVVASRHFVDPRGGPSARVASRIKLTPDHSETYKLMVRLLREESSYDLEAKLTEAMGKATDALVEVHKGPGRPLTGNSDNVTISGEDVGRGNGRAYTVARLRKKVEEGEGLEPPVSITTLTRPRLKCQESACDTP